MNHFMIIQKILNSSKNKFIHIRIQIQKILYQENSDIINHQKVIISLTTIFIHLNNLCK